MEISLSDRRYKTRKRAFDPMPHALRTRILEEFMNKGELECLVRRYVTHHKEKNREKLSRARSMSYKT